MTSHLIFKVEIAQKIMENGSDNKQPSKAGHSSCHRRNARFLVLAKENQISFAGFIRKTRLNKTNLLFQFS